MAACCCARRCRRARWRTSWRGPRGFTPNTDALHARGLLPPDRYDGMYQFGHIHAFDLDRPGAAPFSLLREVVQATALAKLLAQYFGGECAFIVNHCHPRRQKAGNLRAGVPYHQDAVFMGDRFMALNCWVPLVACGENAPGLEVVLDGARQVILPPHLRDAAKSAYEQIALPEPWVRERYGEARIWHPAMQPGDVLIFSNFTIHRTWHVPAMTRDRISLELRCAAPSQALLERGFALAGMSAEIGFAPS